jgi:AcrR family transcriptional regulator
MTDTKTRILDAAEHLIAEHGLEVSLRTITSRAEVNLAAVNYHFQSKDALVDAVIARRLEPVNALRLNLLDALEAKHPAGPLPLEGVLNAFLAPVLRMDAADHVRILIGRIYGQHDEFLRRVYRKHLAGIVDRFGAAIARAAPDMPYEDRMWCMHFTVGCMVHVMAWSRLIGVMTDGAVTPSDTEALTARMVAFTAAGFRAMLGLKSVANRRKLHA